MKTYKINGKSWVCTSLLNLLKSSLIFPGSLWGKKNEFWQGQFLKNHCISSRALEVGSLKISRENPMDPKGFDQQRHPISLAFLWSLLPQEFHWRKRENAEMPCLWLWRSAVFSLQGIRKRFCVIGHFLICGQIVIYANAKAHKSIKMNDSTASSLKISLYKIPQNRHKSRIHPSWCLGYPCANDLIWKKNAFRGCSIQYCLLA